MANRGSSTVEPYFRSLMRIVLGFTFSSHGLQKLLGFFGGFGGHGGTVHPYTLLWVAGCLETVGGALILLGLFTAPAAFILSGEMAVAYFMQHFPHGFWPIRNGGELAVVYCFVFLYLAAAGPGPLSADRALRKQS
jgi:putative oxidoreductase